MNEDYELPVQPECQPDPDGITKPEEPASAGKPKRKVVIATVLVIAAALLFGTGFLTGMFLFRNRDAQPESAVVLSAGQIAERACPAVVLIRATNNLGTKSSGTGFFIRSDGYLLTNYHVVEGAKAIQITLFPGEVKKTARLVEYDAELDLALLYVRGTDFQTIPIGNSDAVAVGDRAIVIGNPLGETCSWTVTQGIISAKRSFRQEVGGTVQESKAIQTDAPVNHGNSGGPLLNERGEVIGVISKKLYDSDEKTILEGIGLAIPINEAMEAAGQWLNEE